MKNPNEELEIKGKSAKAASRRLACLSAEGKNKALANIADDLLTKKDKILAANKVDCQEAEASEIGTAMLSWMSEI